MKTNISRKILVIGMFLITGSPAAIISYLSSGQLSSGSEVYAYGSLKGPLCASGTTYCCKDTAETNCSQDVKKCSNCS